MPVKVEKATTALLVMDVQNDITSLDSPMAGQLGFAAQIERTGMFENLRALMDACRAQGLLVVHVLIDMDGGDQPRLPQRGSFFQMVAGGNVCKRGTPGGEVNPAVKPIEGEPIVYKCIFSAFSSSGLQKILDQHGITDLILSGVSTDAVVESTAWDASDRGFSNILAADCCVCGTQEAHESTVARMSPRCDVATSKEIIDAIC